MAEVSRKQRARSARAFRNDERIRNSAVTQIADIGWDGVSIKGIADHAQMSTRPIYDRFADLSALGVDVWNHTAHTELTDALNRILDLVHAEDRATHQREITEILDALARPTPTLIASKEIISAAWFDSTLRDAVISDGFSDVLDRAHTGEAVKDTQLTYLLATALGALLGHALPNAHSMSFRNDVAQTLRAFEHPSTPVNLPNVDLPQMRDCNVPDDDPVLAVLFTATLEEVTEHGYAAATMNRIAARAMMSQGLIFSRFDSKVELFIAASRRRQLDAFNANAESMSRIAEDHGDGIAEAVIWRGLLDPGHRPGTGLMLEELRLSWHNPVMARVAHEAAANFTEDTKSRLPKAKKARAAEITHADIVRGYGAGLLSMLLPNAWELPWDVVTVPLAQLS